MVNIPFVIFYRAELDVAFVHLQQTFNPPTPKASAWQALTSRRRSPRRPTEESPTSYVESAETLAITW